MEQLREKHNFNYLESLTNAITNLLVKDFQMLKHTISHTVLADKVGNFNINRIIKRILKDSNDETLRNVFIEGIVKVLKLDFKGFLDTKAIFIIVKIAENSQVNNSIMEEVRKNKKVIVNKSTEPNLIGYQLLAKLI